jgi:hypothetical protein
MYVAIIMKKDGRANMINYPNMILFEEDMRDWAHVVWARLFDVETGDLASFFNRNK